MRKTLPVLLVALLLIVQVAIGDDESRPLAYDPQLWHSDLKPGMLERIARSEVLPIMQDRFTAQDFLRMRQLVEGEVVLDPRSPTDATDLSLVRRMRNSSYLLLDSYMLLIRDGRIQSLRDAAVLMEDQRAQVELMLPLLLSNVKLRWEECPECYQEFFRVMQHSFFPDAHENFLMLLHKFGFDQLPETLVEEYIQYVADRNMLASLTPTDMLWLKEYGIQPMTVEMMVQRIKALPRGREILCNGLIRSGSAEALENGLPRPIKFGSIPETSYHQTESWELLLETLLSDCSPRDESRLMGLIHRQLQSSLNRALTNINTGHEYAYTYTFIPYRLPDDEGRELRLKRIERTREILQILGARTDAEVPLEIEDLIPPTAP